MDQRKLNDLLAAVASGEVAPEEAAVQLRTEPFSDLGFAKVDHHRGIRQGASEVVYGAGKTPDQIAAIVANMLDAGEERVLITRIEANAAREVEQLLSEGLALEGADDESEPGASDSACVAGAGDLAGTAGAGDSAGAAGATSAAGAAGSSGSSSDSVCVAGSSTDSADIPLLPVFTYYDLPKLVTIGVPPEPDGAGTIVVACGGTSDIYVAEEAAVTAEMMGNEVVRLYDVGVAGLHRLLAHADELAQASVVVAVAGMEGALPSVVGGLVSCPVIAVPTSVGYGASLGGVSALLAMLNSCASGVSVVNIDNGFGAGYQASLINHVTIAKKGQTLAKQGTDPC